MKKNRLRKGEGQVFLLHRNFSDTAGEGGKKGRVKEMRESIEIFWQLGCGEWSGGPDGEGSSVPPLMDRERLTRICGSWPSIRLGTCSARRATNIAALFALIVCAVPVAVFCCIEPCFSHAALVSNFHL